MKLHSLQSQDHYLVSGYGPDWVSIKGQRYERSLLLLPDRIDPAWGPARGEPLSAAHFEALVSLSGHVILLGTGVRQHFPPVSLLRPLLVAGLAVEAMDTGAACRTFNILVGEGRAVAAALVVE